MPDARVDGFTVTRFTGLPSFRAQEQLEHEILAEAGLPDDLLESRGRERPSPHTFHVAVAGGRPVAAAVSTLGPLADPYTLFLLMLTGPGTAIPLLLFAYAVQRLKLTTMGMLQYISPSIQFVLALVFFGEHLNATRLVSFAFIWASLIIFTTDSVVRRRRPPVADPT